ncbi:hypothetical protein [Actinomadura bangladeshensis]|uniref:Phage portal protein n=1 Tax=Actinomadura bangladeshensis TaxID=453573 RepID=A0A6L9Q875_9ACTN|nr:hypothetical protein [Actinomadura bangladeshensis]NEA21611.1 hypothetical protein [Actinomadura bangladeshensis]NEA22571.1 hypothetical protein [Actinomadura bangladeshensis]
MAVLDRLQESVQGIYDRVTGRSARMWLAESAQAERAMRLHLEESLADLEGRMYEPGWQRLTAMAEQEFSRDGLRQITAVCRIMSIKNSLIKRGLSLRTSYVFGQGVQTTARAAGKKPGEQDVNAVVQKFLADPSNRRTFSSMAACEDLERALGTDGNLFFALFTRPKTGRVQVRTIPWDEITDVITNPQDRSEPWFYRREWWEEDRTSGAVIERRRSAYYPALGYRPRIRPRRLSFPGHGDAGLVEVFWDAPVLHVAVNSPLHWKWGIPDSYAAVDWAKAYTEFLTDWARLIKSLSRFAWKLTTPGRKQAQARARIAASPSHDRHSGEPNTSGATAILPPDMALESVPKSGATIDSESGRPLAAMIAAALDLPVTMLLGDPGVTGSRATAQTLDQPTELAMQMRRELWTEVRRTILDYVIDQAVKAPMGPLSGSITLDEDGREVIALDGDTDRTIDITWPDLDDVNPLQVIQAITTADSTTYVPPLVIVRLLLEALGVKDVDEILETVTGEDGEFIPPKGALGAAGQAALDAFNRGEDPAGAIGGGQGLRKADPEADDAEPADVPEPALA